MIYQKRDQKIEQTSGPDEIASNNRDRFYIGREDFMSESDQPSLPGIKLIKILQHYTSMQKKHPHFGVFKKSPCFAFNFEFL